MKYRSISQESQGFYKEKGSKFLAFAYPIENEGDVKTHAEALRAAYPDARHYCYAYVLATDPIYYRSNDDGEPKHSAGDPILGQIHRLDLKNVVVFVLRYFGGTKLGVSGLVNAYRTASAEALDKAQILEVETSQKISIRFPYEQTSQVQHFINTYEGKVEAQDFGADCFYRLRFKDSVFAEAQAALEELQDVLMIIDS